jgi:hypothetical protein
MTHNNNHNCDSESDLKEKADSSRSMDDDNNNNNIQDGIEVMMMMIQPTTTTNTTSKKNRTPRLLRHLLSFRKPSSSTKTQDDVIVVVAHDDSVSNHSISKEMENHEILFPSISSRPDDGIVSVLLSPSSPSSPPMTQEPNVIIESHYFSKHYVLSSSDQEQIVQLQYDIFGTKQSLTKQKVASTSSVFNVSSWFVGSNTPTSSSSVSSWNTQIDLWNRMRYSTTPSSSYCITTTTTTSDQIRTSQSEQSTTKSSTYQNEQNARNTHDPIHTTCTSSPGIILWRSGRNRNIHVRETNHRNNNIINNNNNNNNTGSSTTTDTTILLPLGNEYGFYPDCEIVVWTTGIMILRRILPTTIPPTTPTTTMVTAHHAHGILDVSSQPNNFNDIHDTTTTIVATTKVAQQPQPKYSIIHVLPWMDLEYIELYDQTSHCTTTNNKVLQPNNQQQSSLSMDANNNRDITTNTIATMATPPTQPPTYQIRCHIKRPMEYSTFSSTNTCSTINSTKWMSNHNKNDQSTGNVVDTRTKPIKSIVNIGFDTKQDRDMVYNLIVKVMIEFHTYQLSNKSISHLPTDTPCMQAEGNEEIPPSSKHVLGWQYHLYYEPYFTMAVTNIMDERTERMTNDINQLDTYNGMTPLHYAVYYNHVPAIVQLIEMNVGSTNPIDFNIVDKNYSWTPLDYCIMYQLPTSTMDLLQQYGATKITVAKVVTNSKSSSHFEIKGELFGKVTATEQIMEERRDDRRRTLQHQQHMIDEQNIQNQNLLIQMQQRGIQIDHLGQNATTLQDNAHEYASMAQQLKERTKRQHDKYNRWFPFG